MPVAPEGATADFVKIVSAEKLTAKIKFKKVSSLLTPYVTSQSYYTTYQTLPSGKKAVYGKNLHEEVKRFAIVASEIAQKEQHDVIHAHDWLTYEAGINAKKISGKPLVVHIHATEFDRTGGNPDQTISHTEYEGLKTADLVIANSNFTKNNVVKHYQINPDKIRVVHWGIDDENIDGERYVSPLNQQDKIVLFLGRVTLQKGPDYFIETAKKVIDYYPKVKFVVAGEGDMLPRIIQRAAELGISHKIVFTGFLNGKDVHKAFQTANLYVMPSVSEPFGLVALEALRNKTPILISKQSGVSEVVNHALKADFWDINEMTNKIVNVLRYEELRQELSNNGYSESKQFNLDEPARKCIQAYKEVLAA